MKTVRTQKEWRRLRQAILAGSIAVLLLISALGESGAVAAAGDRSEFADVTAGQWFDPFVTTLAKTGVISGYPDGTFRPSHQVTVGQFLSMAVQTGLQTGRIIRPEPFDASNTEVEGKKHHWARAFYDCALEESLLFDDELPVTSLDRPISRQWMAVIAVRLMSGEASDRETSVSFERALEQIEDVEELTPYSYEIVTAYQRGLLAGYPDGTFRPEGFLTRAEAAAIIWKLSERKEDGNDQKEPEEPTGGYEEDPEDMTVGTKLFWYRIGGDRLSVKKMMGEHVPELAEQLYEKFCGFTDRAAIEQEGGKQGLRKEYVGGYPVLMEAVGGEIRVYIKPKGSETRFWEVRPGQVSEEFF